MISKCVQGYVNRIMEPFNHQIGVSEDDRRRIAQTAKSIVNDSSVHSGSDNSDAEIVNVTTFNRLFRNRIKWLSDDVNQSIARAKERKQPTINGQIKHRIQNLNSGHLACYGQTKRFKNPMPPIPEEQNSDAAPKIAGKKIISPTKKKKVIPSENMGRGNTKQNVAPVPTLMQPRAIKAMIHSVNMGRGHNVQSLPLRETLLSEQNAHLVLPSENNNNKYDEQLVYITQKNPNLHGRVSPWPFDLNVSQESLMKLHLPRRKCNICYTVTAVALAIGTIALRYLYPWNRSML
jgi:hypothetical protein